MDALFNFQTKVRELKDYVRKNTKLSVSVDVSEYPVKISFYVGDTQLTLFDSPTEESEGIPGVQFIFYDKIEIKTQDDFGVSEEVFNKLKTLSKEINRLYLHAFCAHFNSIRGDLRDFDGVKQIGEEKTDSLGKAYCMAIIKPDTIIDFFDKIRENTFEDD